MEVKYDIMLYALHQYGLHETDERTKRYFTEIGFTEENWANGSTPWCAAFVGWVLKLAGYKYLKTLHARDYLDIYPSQTTDTPMLGDICVFWRGISDDGSKGHVGFFVAENNELVYVLGGNQRDQICIRAYPKDKLLGYVKPIR